MAAVGVLLAAEGCTVVQPYVPETGQYYINPNADFRALGQVVLLTPDGAESYPDQVDQVCDALVQALQKKHLFNVRRVDRSDPAWAELELDRRPWDLDQMRRIRHRLAADGVLVGRVTDYQPYPHLLVGLHLKLVDLRNGMVVWGLEQVWDSQDAKVQKRMRGYYYSRMAREYEPLGWRILNTSGRAFVRFVAEETVQTLPDAHQLLRLRAVAVTEPPRPMRRIAPKRREIRPLPKKILPVPEKDLKLLPSTSTIAMEPQ